MADVNQVRRFVRHPIRVPIKVRSGESSEFFARAGDVSEGGLSFDSPDAIENGTLLDVEMAVHASRFKLRGQVTSCLRAIEKGYRIGLAFVDPGQAFKIKLAEQVIRIEQLQQKLTQERGSFVSPEEAADVWVQLYASTYADLVPK
jgi:hypothetical protein